MRRLVAAVLTPLVLVLASCATTPKPEPVDREIENLRAFATLYGHIRWFHPSDEAATLDWNRFAIHGAEQVRGALDDAALQRALEALFLPVAPTLRIHGVNDPVAVEPVCAGASPIGTVAWQHYGAYLGPGSSTRYRSHRLGRETALHYSADGNFGAWLQRVDVERFRGQRFRIRAVIRTAAGARGSHAQMAFQFRGDVHRRDVRGTKVTSPAWTRTEMTGVVPPDAMQLVFGAYLLGAGSAWFDDFSLEVASDDAWRTVPIENPGFESDAGWLNFGIGEYEYAIVEGSAQVRGEHAGVTVDAPLFEPRPKPGETVTASLGGGLAATYPLTLPDVDGVTCPPAAPDAINELDAALAQVKIDATSAPVRYAAIVVAWNTFQHFYPYFDVVDVDWDRELTRALTSARADDDAHDVAATLRSMLATTRDGHAIVRHGVTTETAPLPFATAWVEGEVVVTASTDDTVRPGDIVRSVDGADAMTVHGAAAAAFAGSDQLRHAQATRRFAAGIPGTVAEVVLMRDDLPVHVAVTRGRTQAIAMPLYEPVAKIADEIWYIDLGRPFDAGLAEHLDAVVDAKGLVIDMRGYPTGDAFGVLEMLSDETLHSARFLVPQIVYPEFRAVTYDEFGIELEPRSPSFDGEVVFLTAGGALSAAETIMGIVEHYELGEIVGSRTAGVNGNANRIDLPGGFDMTFTGVRTLKHDGSQHHLIGIEPTVPLEPTIAGVRAGRDEYIEKAIELIEAGRR